jgi:hypothetical protein
MDTMAAAGGTRMGTSWITTAVFWVSLVALLVGLALTIPVGRKVLEAFRKDRAELAGLRKATKLKD